MLVDEGEPKARLRRLSAIVTTFNEEFLGNFELQDDFINHPRDLMTSVQADSVSPFPEMVGLKETSE